MPNNSNFSQEYSTEKYLKFNKSIETALFVDITTENRLKIFAFSTFYSDF